MSGSPLILTAEVQANLLALVKQAEQRPVDQAAAIILVTTPEGRAAHQTKMSELTIEIPGPWPFFVTFSIEQTADDGDFRHMSMSVAREGRMPNQHALWMVAEILGFVGSLFTDCFLYGEELPDGGKAINVVQRLDTVANRTVN